MVRQTKKGYKKTPIHLKKGDVVFWHPSLLHGSSNQKEEGHSRKSLTAHYYPIKLKKGGQGRSSNSSTEAYRRCVVQNKSQIRRFQGLPIYSNRRRISIKKSVIGAMKYIFNYRNQHSKLMSRSDYSVE